jgi:tetratricopeptide (TPR) repeat protein
MLSSILAVSLLLIASDEGKEEAKRLLNLGNQAFEAGDFAGALAEFEKAFQAYQSPKILVNLGEAHRALENWVQAVLHYERFLNESPPDEPMIPQVESRIAELNAKVARIELAETASATIDGTPARGVVVVAPGAHGWCCGSPGTSIRRSR